MQTEKHNEIMRHEHNTASAAAGLKSIVDTMEFFTKDWSKMTFDELQVYHQERDDMQADLSIISDQALKVVKNSRLTARAMGFFIILMTCAFSGYLLNKNNMGDYYTPLEVEVIEPAQNKNRLYNILNDSKPEW